MNVHKPYCQTNSEIISAINRYCLHLYIIKKGIWFSTIYGMVLISNDGDDQITVIQNSNDLYIADKLANSTIAHYSKHHYFKTGQYMFQLF